MYFIIKYFNCFQAKDKDTTNLLYFSIVAGNVGSKFGIEDG